MKKIYIWSILTLIIAIFLPTTLLAQESTSAYDAGSAVAQHETHVAPAQALNVGYTFMRTGEGSKGNGTKSGSVSKQAMQLVYTGQAYDSLTGTTTDCYYVFALQPKGFVIVAADDRVEPILGYSYDNDFAVANMPDHVRGWLGNYEKQIEAVAKSDLQAEPATQTKWARLKSGQAMSSAKSGGNSVGPLLTTQWNQTYPYNALCPNDGQGNYTMTGCVATMMAQLMKYWDWPKQGTGNHSYQWNDFGTISADFGNTTYNWDNMPNTVSSFNEDIAMLNYHCGVAVDMQYDYWSSGASPFNVSNALKNYFKYKTSEFGFLSGSAEFVRSIIRNQIDMYQPLHISASQHSYIIDGYCDDFFHFNMGWGGSSDGYYIINPNIAEAFYQIDMATTFNIRPNRPIYTIHALNIDTTSANLVTSTLIEESFDTTEHLLWLDEQLPPLIIGATEHRFASTVPAVQAIIEVSGYDHIVTEQHPGFQQPVIFQSLAQGLRPNTNYSFCVRLYNDRHLFVDDTLHFSTPNIDDLSAYPPLVFFDTLFLCSGDVWKGRTLPGDYSDTVLFNESNLINYIIHTHVIGNSLLPTLHLSDSIITVCAGEEVLVVATGADSYTWDNGLLPRDSVMIEAMHDTIYRVTAEIRGCRSTDSVIVHVLPVEQDTIIVTLAPNEIYYWDNYEIIEAGIYYDSTINDSGCYNITQLVVKKPLFSGGLGTVSNPYLISSKTDLEQLADAVINDNEWSRGKHFRVTNDITDTIRIPISMMRGHFHGGGHRIVLGLINYNNFGERVNGSTFASSAFYGLFCVIDEYASVDSLIIDGYVKSNGGSSGSICGVNNGLIQYCINRAVVFDLYAGGIAGQVDHILPTSRNNYGGLIQYCSNSGMIYGLHLAGGICAESVFSDFVKFCSNIGYIYSNDGGATIGISAGGGASCSINAGITESYYNGITSNNDGASGIFMLGVGPNNSYSGELSCIADNQMYMSTLGFADGRNTTNIIGNTLDSIFGPRFTYRDGMYPMPKGMENDSITILAATPVTFWHTDNRMSIKHPFHVYSGNGVTWTSTNNKVVFLENDSVVQVAVGNDTLIAHFGSYRKVIPIEVMCVPTADTLFFSDCESVTVDNIVFVRDTIFNRHVTNQQTEDSILTVVVNIMSKKTHLEYTLLLGEQYNFNGQIITSKGVYHDTLSTMSGCDSIIVLTIFKEPYSGGEGSSESPYLISCKADIEELADNIQTYGDDYSSGLFFLMTNDITDTVDFPVGTFNGVLYADGHSISLSLYNQTLFNYLNGEVHDLILRGVIQGDGATSLGSIAYYIFGDIYNCINYCDILGTCSSGGFADCTWGKMKNCKNYGKITGKLVGGMAAMTYGIIENCVNYGELLAVNCAGGIVGESRLGSSVSNNYNLGKVTCVAANTACGGIVGDCHGNIVDCFNAGLVCGLAKSGGVAGILSSEWEFLQASIVNCVNVGHVTSSLFPGSICGSVEESDTGNITNNYYDCQLSPIGGINWIDQTGKAEARKSTELMSELMQANLSTNWVNALNQYVLLDNLSSDSLAFLASLPLILDPSNTVDSITRSFLVVKKAGVGYSSANNRFIIDNESGLVTLLQLGKDTLNIQYGNYYRRIPLEIAQLPLHNAQILHTGCNSVTVDGRNYYQDTIWTNNISLPNHMDSSVTHIVSLTNYLIENTVTISYGDSIFFRGNVILEEGTYYDSLTTGNGCDSVYILNVNIRNRIYYVKQGALGDGYSWGNALGNIQDAVNLASVSGGAVWVAKGTYYCGELNIPQNVLVLGGFNGDESPSFDISRRDMNNHSSIIDNSNIVLQGRASIDGFVIKNTSKYFTGTGWAEDIHGGILKNCIITDLRCGIAATLYNCIIRDNIGITLSCGFYNCDIVNNSSNTQLFDQSSLVNCIVWNNSTNFSLTTTAIYSAIQEDMNLDGYGSIQLSNNNDGLCDNTNYARFVNPDAGDYRLQNGSACINSGQSNISSLGLPATDIQGFPRVLLGRIDMGAYEYYPVPVVETDVTICEGNSMTFYGTEYDTEGTYRVHANSDPMQDTVYVLHLTVSPADSADFAETACGSYEWNGETFTTSGDYTRTFTNMNGCDSVVTLHLTIQFATSAQFADTTCGSYEWNGITYTVSGDYEQTFTAANGCDSVVTLHLTVNQPTAGVDAQTACGSYTWIDGITYSESNSTSTYTLTNATGCDSIVTLNLTIFPADSAEFAETACDSFEWNGETFTSSGDFTRTLTNANGCDSVVTLHLTIPFATSAQFADTTCGNYEWNGQNYTSSGDHEQTFTAANGCDSVVTLHLTINQPTTGTDVQTACGSYTWIDGITYTESNNTATYTLTNAVGCDSVVTLNLTIFPADSAEFAETACDSFEWNGETFTSSGDFTRTLTNASGCDSVVTLHLTIQFATSAQFADTACGSYEWNGQTYSSSGDYEQTFTAANGCDSIVTLHLTVNQPTTGTDVQNACGSYTWIDGITYTESNNTATFTLTNAEGCDSLVTLNLTIFPADSAEFAETACDSFEWNGETFTSSGDFTRTLTNASGCDSVVTLHLTIHFATSAQFADTACGSYEWNGQTYTSSGDYTQTLTAANGCDSVVTLHLTITVSIDDYNNFVFNLYPNPTNGIVNLQSTMNNVQMGTMEFHVFDAYGKLVAVVGTRCTSSLQTAQIDLSGFTAGVYFVKAVADGNVVAVRKMVKR